MFDGSLLLKNGKLDKYLFNGGYCQHTDNNALYAFVGFIGFGTFLLMIYSFSWTNFVNNLWLFVWLSVLYTPITALDNWAKS